MVAILLPRPSGWPRFRSLGLLLAAAQLGACTTMDLSPQTLGIAPTSSEHSEPPVEIYSRIARSALSCWFGASGSLKRTHIFHADLASAESGADIVVHERDRKAENPRGAKAYRIAIARSGPGSSVATENLRLPEAVARDMSADVLRWAAGKTGCSVVGVGGWGAERVAEPPPPPVKAAKKPRQRTSN